MPGIKFKIWGPPRFQALPFKQWVIAGGRHRYVPPLPIKLGFLTRSQASVSQTTGRIPRYLNAFTRFRWIETFPPIPEPVPTVQNFQWYTELYKARNPQHVGTIKFFQRGRLVDIVVPSTDKIVRGFFDVKSRPHRIYKGNLSHWGVETGSGVGPIVPRPKFGYLRSAFAKHKSRVGRILFGRKIHQPVVTLSNDLPKPYLKSRSKHRISRGVIRTFYRPKFIPGVISDFHDLILLTALTVKLDVRFETDSGIINALAADATGTLVTFNKAFKDISGITATPNSTSDLRALINFIDVPNPTDFRILVYNAAGARVNAEVRWIARGII